MSPILGIYASQISGHLTPPDTGAMFPISAITVGSAGAASIEFTSIPSTYKHLQIRGLARGTASATDLNVELQFNSDTSTNYSIHGLYGTGTSVVAYGDVSSSNGRTGRITGASSSASMFGVMVTDILEYANTNIYKTIRTLTGHDQNGSGLIFFNSSNWRSTSAVTSIKLYAGSGNFAQYSSFALYGIKGA